MTALLPPKSALKIRFRPVADRDAVTGDHELSIWLVAKNLGKTLLKQCQRSPELLREWARVENRQFHAALRLSACETSGIILCIFVKDTDSAFEKLQVAAKAWKEAAPNQPASVALATLGLADAEGWQEALLAATLAGSASLPQYKAEPSHSPLKRLTLLTDASPERFAATLATHHGNHLARWLTAQPPNLLDSRHYRSALQTLARQQGWQSQFYSLEALAKLNAGAFLAVARASQHQAAGILRLRYRAKSKRARPRLALVGKGICFDTGGINLKPHRGMYDMHTDMQGSAVAVGTLLALSEMRVGYDIDCWLAITENDIGPQAYRPQEVVTAANGVTIQVVHSDAEGRMALADTLVLAAREKPALVLDFATLTGACVQALTERMSGAFTNHADLRAAIEQAGRASGERVWCFPMDSDFDADLDSPIADVMQCTLDNKGDHILAARFLNRFVPDTIPWIHIDLSSATRSGGLAHIPSEITGFGVRWAVQFLSDHSFQIAT